MFVRVRGRTAEWSFHFNGDPKHLEDWRADGLEVNEVYGSAPEWVCACGLAGPWFAAQRLWQWLRVW